MISTAFKTPTKKLSCHSFFVHWNQGTKIEQEEKSTRFKVCCLLFKLMFIKNLRVRVARDQGSVRASIHLSNPNICKLLNVIHHSLSIGQLVTYLLILRILTQRNLKVWRYYEGRAGKTRRCSVIANREHLESWNMYFCHLVDMCYSHNPISDFPSKKKKFWFIKNKDIHILLRGGCHFDHLNTLKLENGWYVKEEFLEHLDQK